MESAIAQHLRCPRSETSSLPEGHSPAYPAWTARLDQGVSRIVFASFGVQWNRPGDEATANDYIRALVGRIGGPSGADYHDLAKYRDEEGYETLVLLAYWLDQSSFEQWRSAPDLAGLGSSILDLGRFEEVIMPEVNRVETLYSSPDAIEGIGKTAQQLSDEIVEHAYWGSARDRLPISQTDALLPSGTVAIDHLEGQGKRVVVKGHENIAVIRSGQDWSATTGEERDLYLTDIAPPLRAGMDFLRDRGLSIGCYCNRYMQQVDLDGRYEEKTFGWSYWRSLAEMEQWAEDHPTHLAIFGTFNKVVAQLNFDLDLKLSHEIYVVRPEEQFYSYVNCHPQTGFLKAVNSGSAATV